MVIIYEYYNFARNFEFCQISHNFYSISSKEATKIAPKLKYGHLRAKRCTKNLDKINILVFF